MYGAVYFGQTYFGGQGVAPLAGVSQVVTLVYNIIALTVLKTLTLVYNLSAGADGRELYGSKTLYGVLATQVNKADPTMEFDGS